MRRKLLIQCAKTFGLLTIVGLAQLSSAFGQTGETNSPRPELPEQTQGAKATPATSETGPQAKAATSGALAQEPTEKGTVKGAEEQTKAVEGADGPCCCPSDGCPSFWEKNPPVRLLPRTGFFPIVPTGPGYYSLRDFVTDDYKEKRPNFPYSPISFMANSFFDADFRYLEKPNNTQTDIFDFLHNIHLGDCWLFNTGGEFRYRHESEIGGPKLTGLNNNYDLLRTRVYGDLWYSNIFRVYAEFINAQINNNTQPPLAIDRNIADLLNAFVDVRLFEYNDHPAYLRVGRQEMLLGSQRLISPLDWANTRRTFQGAKAFRQGECFDVDFFYMQPVVIQPYSFDWVDNNQHFAGAWLTKRPQKGETIDMYWLYYDNTNKVNTLGETIDPTVVHTFGARWAGDQNRDCDGQFKVLWDFEGMTQFGTRGVNQLFAGAATAGLGANYACDLNPTFWIYYDYASGSKNPSGENTFNQLFPFGHLYLGWIDAVGRQNIHDLNMHLFTYPTKWVTFWAQYHHFWLASPTDALYNASGAAIRRDATGNSGSNVGDEIDFVLNFHLGPHSDFALGYSKLFPGPFLQNAPGSSRPPEMFFMQYSFRW